MSAPHSLSSWLCKKQNTNCINNHHSVLSGGVFFSFVFWKWSFLLSYSIKRRTMQRNDIHDAMLFPKQKKIHPRWNFISTNYYYDAICICHCCKIRINHQRIKRPKFESTISSKTVYPRVKRSNWKQRNIRLDKIIGMQTPNCCIFLYNRQCLKAEHLRNDIY